MTFKEFREMIDIHRGRGRKIEKVHIRKDILKKIGDSMPDLSNNGLVPKENTIIGIPVVIEENCISPEIAVFWKNIGENE